MSRLTWAILACFIWSTAAAPQQPDAAKNPAAPSSEPSTADDEHTERAISPKLLVPNILHDQKPIWSFPLKVAEGRHWKPVLGLTLATAGLVILDPYSEPYFRNNSGFNTYKTGPLRGRNTTLAITLTPVAFYLGALTKRDRFAQNSALLAAEAIADTQIVSLAMKAIDGRLHPSDIPPHGNFRDTWFKYKGTFTNPGAFPSGHACSAFAVATVFANRYRHHRWVPWLAYGTATFVALTRVPDQAHFPSDIFAGAVFGYTISRFVVLRK